MITYRRYGFVLLAFALLQTFAVALFNFTIDPYGVLNSRTFVGINKVKPLQSNQGRLFKAIQVIEIEPKVIFLGSSRTQIGLDPSSAVFDKHQPVYNLGLAGANMYEARRYFEHALFVQPDLKIVVLGIDMFMFIDLAENKPNFLEDRLEKKRIILKDFFDTTFSIDSLVASIKTIKTNKYDSKLIPPFYPMGLRNPDERKQNVFQNLPTTLLFKKYLENRQVLFQQDMYQKGKISESFLNDLKEVVSQCREREIELKIFISPIHVTQLELLRLAGLWPLVEQWKQEIVKIAPIWDFSGYNSITTEPITNEMKNYIESSHYMPEVGNLILSRLFEYNEEKIPENFGVMITEKNIKSNLEKTNLSRDNWLKNYPEMVELLNKLEYK